MNNLKAWFSVGWRVAVCLLLLLWIFHSIFMYDARLLAQRSGIAWEQLPRQEQWHQAWTVGPKDLWHTICQVKIAALVISVALMGLVVWLGVVRWRLVLAVQGLILPLGRATSISLVAQFFNSFLLGSTGGDFIKAYYAARETHHLKTEAVTTVFVDRLVGLWAMLLFAGLMMPTNLPMLQKDAKLEASAALILAMLVSLTIVLVLAFWGGVSKRFPRARHYFRRLPKGEVLEKSLDSCRQFGKEKMFLLKTVAMSLFINVILVLQIYALCQGLDLNVPLMALMVIVPIVTCITAVPISLNGLGVRETLFVLMLGVVAVPSPAALSVSLLASAEGLFWSAVGGFVYMGVRDKEHLSEVTAESATENNL